MIEAVTKSEEKSANLIKELQKRKEVLETETLKVEIEQKELLQAKALKEELKSVKNERMFVESLQRQQEAAAALSLKALEEHKAKKEALLHKIEQQAMEAAEA
jgi:hypothetical protein